MWPQIIVAVWLTLVWVRDVITMGTDDFFDLTTSMTAAGMHIAIPVIALYYAGFWSI